MILNQFNRVQSSYRLRELRGAQTEQSQRGYALVVALSLMAFILLIVLGFSTLVGVESASAARSQQALAARQNAYLALMVAVGELQKTAGPDQRVTARAGIFDEDDGVELENSYWMGVWDTTEAGWDALGADERMQRARWIVSGNEGLNPGDANYWTPKVELIGNIEMASADVDFDLDAVAVPLQELNGASGGTAGRYGYWVSGDNSKALVSLSDPYVDTTDREEKWRSLTVPQRTAVEAVDRLNHYPVNDPSLERVLDLSPSVEDWISDGSVDTGAFVRVRSHDLTTWSKGLLVDVKDGALKRDLTQAFEINASFEQHFPEVTFGSQSESDDEAADPTTPEPYYFVEDPLIVSGSPNWSVLRDYYQHYWPDVKEYDTDYQINLKSFEVSHDGTRSDVYKYLPYRSPLKHSDPYAGGSLPYQRVFEGSYGGTQYQGGDNYQYTSWITPVVSQFRISHAFRLEYDGVKTIPEIIIRPVITMYNPYNVKMKTNDCSFRWSLNPKITLTLYLSAGTQTVEFYQTEIQDSGQFGTFQAQFEDPTYYQPGVMTHEAYNADKFGGDSDAGSSNNPRMTTKWETVGGIRLPLDEHASGYGPEMASQNGAISVEDARVGGKKENHPLWGISQMERDWLQQAISDNAPITIRIDYEDFGDLRGYVNSTAASQSFLRIDDIWRPESDDQPDHFEQGYGTISSATAQDSFQTLVFAMRPIERIQGSSSETDAIRNLVDTNVRAIFSNSMWDGNTGHSRYLTLFDADILGQNNQSPDGFIDENDRQNGYWGRSIEEPSGSISEGAANYILFERPRSPLLSVGQLMHANLSRYHFDPTYIIGNSFASVRIPLTDTSVTGFGDEEGLKLFDLSYLVNERLWDGFFFSSLEIPPAEADRDTLKAELVDGSQALSDVVLNPRMEFIASQEQPIDRYERIALFDTSSDDFENAVYRPASEMWVNGAFNVNSTSIEAWKAVLSSTSKLSIPIYDSKSGAPKSDVSEDNAVYSRVIYRFFEGFENGDDATLPQFWNGYRKLNSSEITTLAESIVSLIKERGPFLSMASFINRKLEDSEAGKKGVLQAALDGMSTSSGVNQGFHEEIAGEEIVGFSEITNFLFNNISSGDRSNIGFPGYLLQSDLLQHLAPILTVRSDTFTIRTYGDVINPVTQEITSRVWCEAKVQRVPDPVAGSSLLAGADAMDEFIQPSSPFGRQFKILSFTWLDPEDI